jgi:hypothetical protein
MLAILPDIIIVLWRHIYSICLWCDTSIPYSIFTEEYLNIDGNEVFETRYQDNMVSITIRVSPNNDTMDVCDCCLIPSVAPGFIPIFSGVL